jgi:hypothetical protein
MNPCHMVRAILGDLEWVLVIWLGNTMASFIG